MKAVVIREHGDLDRLLFEDRAEPEPGPKEVLIRVRACALNHLDTWVRRGVPGHKFPLPLIPGCDVAGVVERLGPGASGVSVGDEVVVAPGFGCGVCEHCAAGDDNLCRHYGIFGETCDGGCAETIRVPDRNCIQKPENLDFFQAAAMPLVFLTAWHMLVERARVLPGMNLLIQAVGSGVGTAALQIAKLHGARVIATAGTDAKLERALEMGADQTVNYKRDDFLKAVKQFTGGQGVDIAIDHVGEPTIGRSIAALRKGGTLVTCGATAGFKLETDLRLIFFKSLSLLGSTMGSLGEVHKVMNLAREGLLKPVIHSVLPMSEIKEAHRLLKDREVFGKVVVHP
ncbi:MAG: zinc-binding dehydrogenase [Planctomycetota bacterium]